MIPSSVQRMLKNAGIKPLDPPARGTCRCGRPDPDASAGQLVRPEPQVRPQDFRVPVRHVVGQPCTDLPEQRPRRRADPRAQLSLQFIGPRFGQAPGQSRQFSGTSYQASPTGTRSFAGGAREMYCQEQNLATDKQGCPVRTHALAAAVITAATVLAAAACSAVPAAPLPTHPRPPPVPLGDAGQRQECAALDLVRLGFDTYAAQVRVVAGQYQVSQARAQAEIAWLVRHRCPRDVSVIPGGST